MKKSMKTVLATILGISVGAGVGAVSIAKVSAKEEKKWRELADKHLALMQLYNQWMITKQEGKSIVDYFKRENIKTVAIYGMSYVGERLYDELKETEIDVKFAIDRNADTIYAELDVITPEDSLEEIDAIIVTPIFYFDEIEEMLREKTDALILSLEDILYEI